MMRRVAVGAMVAALCAAPVLAAVSEIDKDGDALASFEEMVAAYPDLTEMAFGEIDTDDDGYVNEAELVAAVEAGLLTAADE
jgi:Ca2+-binding EF-hand superfamily protein